jgi:CubicO group peptidase (beta-lactamase class C family)
MIGSSGAQGVSMACNSRPLAAEVPVDCGPRKPRRAIERPVLKASRGPGGDGVGIAVRLGWNLAITAWFGSAPAFAASPYDEVFDAVMARYHLPGLAVGVIEDGKVAYMRTAGELAADSGRKVTPDTLFKIASNSKAMTTALLARLVATGKLRWDDPVTKYLPAFRMYEPWVTENIQVSDLLVHNSGLREGAGDLMLWPEPNRFTRRDIISGLAYLKPQTSFRSGYAYDNLLYVVAGEVAAAAGGASYEELVTREVFVPLGLSCRVGEWRSVDVPDAAQPHMRKDGQNVVINADAETIPAITSAAAGGIRCSLRDMLSWAQNWLVPDDRQKAWLTPEQRRPLWTAHTPMPISKIRRERDHSHFYAYGYGWRLSDVDNVWTVSHTGTLAGMYSVLTLLPDKRSGFVMMTNGNGGEARVVLNEVLLKHFTAPTERHSVTEYADAMSHDASAASSEPPDTTAREPATAAQAQPLLGVWRDPWFGEISICARADAVRFNAAKSPLMAGQVMRVGERWLVAWDDERIDAEAWLNLGADPKPKKRVLTMAKVDPAADFSLDFEDLSFKRERDCE